MCHISMDNCSQGKDDNPATTGEITWVFTRKKACLHVDKMLCVCVCVGLKRTLGYMFNHGCQGEESTYSAWGQAEIHSIKIAPSDKLTSGLWSIT